MYIGLILSIILLQKNQYYAEIIVQRSNQLQFSVALKTEMQIAPCNNTLSTECSKLSAKVKIIQIFLIKTQFLDQVESFTPSILFAFTLCHLSR